MKSVKPQSINTFNFVEGGNVADINFRPKYPAKKVLFNFSGPVVISNNGGTVVPTIKAASDGTILFPYLLQMLGKITFTGTCKAGKGLKINNVPLWVFWLIAYIENKGVGPVVDDGGMLAANFAAGTYNISVDIPINFYDPLTPKSQHQFTYFRPNRYDKDTKFNITGGKLWQTPYNAGIDGVATTDLTTNASALAYTTAIVISVTTYLVPDLPFKVTDECADFCYQYTPVFDATASDFNDQTFSDLEVQQYIHMIMTNLSLAGGAGTNNVEAGVDGFGAANNGIVETDIGTETLAKFYAVNQKAHDIDEFMTSVSAWFKGLLTIDEYDHNWSEYGKKTFLNTNIASHVLNAYGIPDPTYGSNFKLIHKTAQLSDTAKAKIATLSVSDGKYPVFAGQ